jgi:hypothetical protein
MHAGPLPNWPVEPLKEWLYRHANNMEDYAFLGFEAFEFELTTWDVDRFPGREAFRDEGFCDSFQNVEERAAGNKYDWLAHYMLKEGTWNTPIILLDNRGVPGLLRETTLKTPYHLLEGHRRLSFLHGIKRLGKARPQHPVWIVRRPSGTEGNGDMNNAPEAKDRTNSTTSATRQPPAATCSGAYQKQADHRRQPQAVCTTQGGYCAVHHRPGNPTRPPFAWLVLRPC